MPFAAVLPHRGPFQQFHARILLRRIHAAVGSPIFRSVWNAREFIFDSIKSLGQQIKSILARVRRRRCLQPPEEFLQSFPFRDHAMILPKQIPNHKRETLFPELQSKTKRSSSEKNPHRVKKWVVT